MNQPHRLRDAGQAFPIYITVVAGLLFLALAYLAVGQAAVSRSGAQTAADATALAAAQKTRDQLAALWVDDVLDPTKWRAIFDGEGGSNWCLSRSVTQFAAQNGAKATYCHPDSPLSYVVHVVTIKNVGESVVPRSERYHGKASARAVIQPLCKPPGEDAGGDTPPKLTCKDHRNWVLKPGRLTHLPRPEDLFDVHLAK
ncbi:pilus assembly protein TadG-related protein [Streptomyces sp. NPDC002671]